LFSGNWAASANGQFTNRDVHPDGAPFILVRRLSSEADEAGTGPPVMQVEVVVNWSEELRERMGN
jgi:hypothetical protein